MSEAQKQAPDEPLEDSFYLRMGHVSLMQRCRATEAEVKRLRDALEMLYEKYEDGDPCTENGDDDEGYMGNAVCLSAEEEDQILALISEPRKQASAANGE